MKRVRVEAYAKINLGLRVLARRPDGYHEIDTVYQSVDLADHISFELRETPRISLEVHPPSEPDTAPEENLAYRAAQLLRARVGFKPGVHIRLTKRIPIGAGLGGGSSDAAATLSGLSALLDLDMSVEALQQMALKLGCDVPFFFEGGRRRARGLGERIEATPDGTIPPHVVLIVPPFRLSTRRVYEALDQGKRKSLPRSSAVYPNDLEPVALDLRPELRRYRAFLERAAVPFGMSGSGPAFYALLHDRGAAERLSRALRSELSGRTFQCRTSGSGFRFLS